MDAVEDARSAASARQTEIYGESWADRLHRLMAAYRLSQARLAGVIGLSAPMLSQLISGQRVKISNPAVYGRIVALEEACADPGFARRDAAEIDALLARTAASQPVLSTRVTAAGPPAGDGIADALAALAPTAALAAAADAVRATAPALAAVLDAASVRAGRPRS
ncbi:DNA-binding protein [Nakamurella deserti]|uniref:DNA-binding protein n=1 Tax=Nakamurella deserti TaxID=2164074 RepID=UPI000DBE86BA|nr:DNA-binding protein [Nakamurella deserti]